MLAQPMIYEIGKSKAIYALQEALQKQQALIEACRVMDFLMSQKYLNVQHFDASVEKIRKILSKYNKV